MKKWLALGAVALGLFIMACQYTPPPGGVSAYCWRVQYDQRVGEKITFYTDIKPLTEGTTVEIRNAWYAADRDAKGIPSRYDRYIERVVLSSELADRIDIRPNGPPSRCSY